MMVPNFRGMFLATLALGFALALALVGLIALAWWLCRHLQWVAV